MTSGRLGEVHHLLARARASGVLIVPAVIPTRDGRTYLDEGGRLWELTTWLPGRADFHRNPSPVRLAAACEALARLHRAWEPAVRAVGPCPGIRRRVECAREWVEFRSRVSVFPPAGPEHLNATARRGDRLLARGMAGSLKRLQPWLDRPVRLQPCLCDVWHDHVLFEGERLTGLVDFGAVKTDNVAVDLARLLGSLVRDDPAARMHGLAAYSRVRTLAPEEEELVGLLDETGTLLGVANWMLWIYRDRKEFEDPHAAADRLAVLVDRIERWPAGPAGVPRMGS